VARHHQLLDRDAGAKPGLMVADMVQRVVKGGNHRVGRAAVAHPPGPADVDAEAVSADQVGVEGDDLVILHDPRPAFLKPRVGARARWPAAASRSIRRRAGCWRLVQFGPDRHPRHAALRHIRAGERLHLGNPRLAGVVGAAHRQNLVRPLHRAHPFGHLLAFSAR
jgi:hypothetical protein